MSVYHKPDSADVPYKDPTPLPADVPKVQELGTTSAPLKSAAFFIGAYCKDYNGECSSRVHTSEGTYVGRIGAERTWTVC